MYRVNLEIKRKELVLLGKPRIHLCIWTFIPPRVTCAGSTSRLGLTCVRNAHTEVLIILIYSGTCLKSTERPLKDKAGKGDRLLDSVSHLMVE